MLSFAPCIRGLTVTEVASEDGILGPVRLRAGMATAGHHIQGCTSAPPWEAGGGQGAESSFLSPQGVF